MTDHRLKEYYEEELRFLRKMGADFARQHQEVADGLRLEPNRCDDPHVERLLEGFAFLAARVHRRIDDPQPAFLSAGHVGSGPLSRPGPGGPAAG